MKYVAYHKQTKWKKIEKHLTKFAKKYIAGDEVEGPTIRPQVPPTTEVIVTKKRKTYLIQLSYGTGEESGFCVRINVVRNGLNKPIPCSALVHTSDELLEAVRRAGFLRK